MHERLVFAHLLEQFVILYIRLRQLQTTDSDVFVMGTFFGGDLYHPSAILPGWAVTSSCLTLFHSHWGSASGKAAPLVSIWGTEKESVFMAQ